jgi:hypothetical protein
MPMLEQAHAAPPPGAVGVAPGAKLGVFAYPMKKQNSAQQVSDEWDCWTWARGKTGVDPFAPQTGMAMGPPPPATPPIAGAAGGAAVGAAGGAALGALVGGRAGRGAAIGSALGAVSGHQSTRQANAAARQQQAQFQQAAAAQQAQQTDLFRRAYSACLSGKGYSVR